MAWLLVTRRKFGGFEADAALAAVIGAIAGGLLGQSIIGWLTTACTGVAVTYQHCHPASPSTGTRFLIIGASVVCASWVVCTVYRAMRLP